MSYRIDRLGLAIKAARESLSLTRTQFAKKIHVSCSFLGMVERGEKKASLETLCRIADLTNTTVDSLLGGSRSFQNMAKEEYARYQLEHRIDFPSPSALYRTQAKDPSWLAEQLLLRKKMEDVIHVLALCDTLALQMIHEQIQSLVRYNFIQKPTLEF
ncbi:helix-turn-helix domain-containing protein [Anaerotalea alkaliphila]|uniref:Helix-turn-helix transcriptional regulator n=1 Tax=Anaerotalea alkaliphila TaxID=2662126 RepID=A0A7X5HWM8_9FIRM|nr:helix-turn-helix transcriptional regulator [Anaerotalea alkaliphila]NDL67987.1 helix-turn-helix transcriptional regulator [Anaerotalea alkaliphila]